MSKRSWGTIGGLVLIALLLSSAQAGYAAAPVRKATTMTANALSSTTLADDAAPTRVPLWTVKTGGAVWASPTVQDGTVYVGSDDKNLYAVDAQTGQVRWSFGTGGLVRSRPAVEGGHIFFASDDGNLYALGIQKGQLLWKLDIGNAAVARVMPGNNYTWDYLQSSPTLADGIIYIGSADSHVYAVDAKTGEEKWRFKTGGLVRSTPAVSEGSVYVASWDGFIYSIDASNGTEKWRFDARGEYVGIQPSPAVVKGVVYVGSRGYYLYALTAQTGKEVWKFRYTQAWVESSATVVDGVVYVGSSEDRSLYAIDSVTGEKQWKFATDGYAFSSPTVADGVVYIGTARMKSENPDGYFYAVDIQTAQARKVLIPAQAKWRVKIDPTVDTSPTPITGVVSSPTVSHGVVFFGGLDGKLYAVNTAS